MGSLAKFRKRHTFSIDPFSSKSCLKNRAASILTCNTHELTLARRQYDVMCVLQQTGNTYAHRSEDDGEVVFVRVENVFVGKLHQTSLTTDLCCNLKQSNTSNVLLQLSRLFRGMKGNKSQVLRCEVIRSLRRWGFSGREQCCSCRQWRKFPSESFLRGRFATRD